MLPADKESAATLPASRETRERERDDELAKARKFQRGSSECASPLLHLKTLIEQSDQVGKLQLVRP
jgi:hypothetical protein